jgi:hypothetical protein
MRSGARLVRRAPLEGGSEDAAGGGAGQHRLDPERASEPRDSKRPEGHADPADHHTDDRDEHAEPDDGSGFAIGLPFSSFSAAASSLVSSP